MKIAALYAQVSSAKQQLNENIAWQIAAIQEYAQQNDYLISPQHIYKDDGFSGAWAGSSRPGSPSRRCGRGRS
jgi:DNA invertase Pin-like site-specific DNA recombinase